DFDRRTDPAGSVGRRRSNGSCAFVEAIERQRAAECGQAPHQVAASIELPGLLASWLGVHASRHVVVVTAPQPSGLVAFWDLILCNWRDAFVGGAAAGDAAVGSALELVALVVEEGGLPGPNCPGIGALNHCLVFRLLDSSQIHV